METFRLSTTSVENNVSSWHHNMRMQIKASAPNVSLTVSEKMALT